MKRIVPRRLLSLVLTGMLIITGFDVAPVHAAEESIRHESMTDTLELLNETAEAERSMQTEVHIETSEQQTQSAKESTKEQTEAAGETAQEQSEGPVESSEQNTETADTESAQQTETANEASEQQTDSSDQASEQQTDSSDQASEQQTDSSDQTSEQQTEALTEKPTTVESETQAEESETVASEESETLESETEESDTTESEIAETETAETETEESDIPFEIVVNPLYEGLISADEIEAQLGLYQDIRLLSESDQTSFDTLEDAAAYVSRQMVARAADIYATIPLSIVDDSGIAHTEYPKTLFNASVAHTEECSGQEGDTLRWSHGGYASSYSTNEEANTYTAFLKPVYYTTYEQEQELTAKVNEALDGMALSGKSDYEKVKAIHDYICDTVNYDYTNLEDKNYTLKYTAYAALCNNTAVCQGYAVAFYRMCKEIGLPVRIITGTGIDAAHAWNIVKIGSNTRAAGDYYNIDCTWDGQDDETYHIYFLKNEEDFVDHVRDAEYNTAAFHAQYPMSRLSYVDQGSLVDGLNKDNPAYEYTTIDDTKVHTTANQKPKLLIYFNTGCMNSQSTIRAIAGHDFGNVDIYAAEMLSHSKEAVAEFKAAYANDTITFTYDTQPSPFSPYSQTYNDAFSYIRLSGGDASRISLPLLCYIDANNKLQNLTQGPQNASQIEVNLKKYCGMTSDPDKPGEDPDKPGEDPDKPGEDPDKPGEDPDKPGEDPDKPGEDPDKPGEDPDKPGENPDQPGDSDTTPAIEYTVNFNTQGHGNAPQSYTGIKSGELIQKPADPNAQGYRFDGWYKDSSCKTAWNFNTDKVTADTTLYAKWVKLDAPADEDISKYPTDQRKDLKPIAKIAEIKAKVYDGTPYTPVVKVTVSDGGKQITLTEGADYRVLYTNNIVPGTAKVIVRGNGTYKGEITKEFQITKKPLKNLNIVAGGMSVDAKTDNLPVYVYDGAVELVKGTDYTLSNLTDVKGSSAKITVTAAKNSKYYEGSVTTKVTLYKADADKIINAEHVTLSAKSVPYTGKAVTSVVPTVKIGNVTLEKNKQYKVQYKNNTTAGTALVIITGKGQYKGKVVKSFTIEPSKSKFTVSSISDRTYNGKLQKPTVIVKDGTKKLKVNRDYTVTYAKNLSAGKATVTITGIGNYAGSAPVTANFTIKSQKISKITVKGTLSKGIVLTYNKKPLVEGVDYKLTLGTAKKGKTQVSISGIGDFTGTITKSVKN